MNTARILVQDLDSDILIIIAHVLEGEGYNVLTTTSYDEVVHAVGSFRPDLIFLDFFLRGEHCIEAFERIKSQYPGIPVIALGSNPTYSRGRSQGRFDGFIEKPFVIGRIIDACEKICHSKCP